MNLLYANKSKSSPKKSEPLAAEFSYQKLSCGETIPGRSEPRNQIDFILQGALAISGSEIEDEVFRQGEMVLLPEALNCQGVAIAELEMICLKYDTTAKFCDKEMLKSMSELCQKKQPELAGLAIREPLTDFLRLIRDYVRTGLNLDILHEIKLEELFIILRFYYSLEELAQLFMPGIRASGSEPLPGRIGVFDGARFRVLSPVNAGDSGAFETGVFDDLRSGSPLGSPLNLPFGSPAESRLGSPAAPLESPSESPAESSLEFRSKVLNNYLLVKNAKALALACGYSERAFQRLFHRNFNDTPYQWMLKQIARHVQARLASKNVPLKCIADEFNFSSPAHLCTFCKAQLGATPMQLRKHLCTLYNDTLPDAKLPPKPALKHPAWRSI